MLDGKDGAVEEAFDFFFLSKEENSSSDVIVE